MRVPDGIKVREVCSPSGHAAGSRLAGVRDGNPPADVAGPIDVFPHRGERGRSVPPALGVLPATRSAERLRLPMRARRPESAIRIRSPFLGPLATMRSPSRRFVDPARLWVRRPRWLPRCLDGFGVPSFRCSLLQPAGPDGGVKARQDWDLTSPCGSTIGARSTRTCNVDVAPSCNTKEVGHEKRR